MNAKTFPFVALLAAAILFFWVKSHQRGGGPGITTEKATDAYTVLRGGDKTIVYSRHARCRMDCRHIDEREVKEILDRGEINFNKIEHSDKGASYPVEGKAYNGEHLRIVFAPHQNQLVVVTVIDLDKDFECDCK